MNPTKRNRPWYARLVVDNSAMDGYTPSLDRPLKVRSKLFDMADSGIFDLAAGDLLDRSLGDTASSGNLAPASLGRLEACQNELVHRSHGANDSPVFGFTQPSNGGSLSLRFSRMGRPRQPSAPKSRIGKVFTENVEALLPLVFSNERTETKRIEALAKEVNVGKETIRRAIRGGASSRLDVVDSIAQGLGVTAPQLLTPGYGAVRVAEIKAQARHEPASYPRAGSSSR
jgi:hypothetical protein